MNHIEIEGRLGQNPEIKETSGGLKIYNMNLATTVRQSGQDETLWYKVSFFSGRHDKMIECLKKGSAISVVGTLQIPRVYQAKDGEHKCSLEVRGDMLSFCIGSEKKEGGQPYSNKGSQEGKQSYEQASRSADRMVKAEFSDLPF